MTCAGPATTRKYAAVRRGHLLGEHVRATRSSDKRRNSLIAATKVSLQNDMCGAGDISEIRSPTKGEIYAPPLRKFRSKMARAWPPGILVSPTHAGRRMPQRFSEIFGDSGANLKRA